MMRSRSRRQAFRQRPCARRPLRNADLFVLMHRNDAYTLGYNLTVAADCRPIYMTQ